MGRIPNKRLINNDSVKKSNPHTELLIPYIFYAPEFIKNKFYNECNEGNVKGDFYKENNSYFLGLMFINGRVFCYNILQYKQYEENEGNYCEYLEITDLFNDLLNTYNIFHLCILIYRALKSQAREHEAMESFISFMRFQMDNNLQHRYLYERERQNNRFRKFIVCKESSSNTIWDKVILRAIERDRLSETFRKHKQERPSLLWRGFEGLSEFRRVKDSHETS